MNNLSKTRGTAYATGIVIGLASLAKLMGLAEFDPSTGMFDPHPFSIYVLTGLLTPVVAAGLALLAWAKGWTSKQVKGVKDVFVPEVSD